MEPSRNETMKQKCQKPVKLMTKRSGKVFGKHQAANSGGDPAISYAGVVARILII